jgi:aryl-alcohol dehydrogenase-like predicted oxidoreductase
LRRAFAVHPIAALQSEYSLWARDVETDIFPVCRELGIGFVPYSPLGSGFLTGQIKSPDDFPENDLRRRIPRFQGENFIGNLKLVEIIRQIAAEKNCTPAQMALAWVLAQGEDVIPIPGTKRRKYLEENVGALNVTLDADDLKEINKVFPPDAAVGSLRSEKMTQMMGRER